MLVNVILTYKSAWHHVPIIFNFCKGRYFLNQTKLQHTDRAQFHSSLHPVLKTKKWLYKDTHVCMQFLLCARRWRSDHSCCYGSDRSCSGVVLNLTVCVFESRCAHSRLCSMTGFLCAVSFLPVHKLQTREEEEEVTKGRAELSSDVVPTERWITAH